MNQPLISIIVPVYNVEKYIERCIESILEQSFRDFELILVNDGSKDDSLTKCRLWEADRRVRIFSIENHGVSYARNLGLQHAIGKWILFLDSDDYLIEGCLEQLVSLTNLGAQEISGLYVEGEETFGTQQYALVDAKSVMKMSLDSVNHNLLPDFYPLKPSTLLFCAGKLYLNEVIKKYDVKFQDKLRLSEDLLFHLDYLSHIDNVIVTNVAVLFYRQDNVTAVTKRFNPTHLADRVRLIEKLKEMKLDSANVHIVATMFLFISKMEKHLKGSERKEMEQKILALLGEHKDVFVLAKGKKLSHGRWQNLFYQMALVAFLTKWPGLGFRVLKLYTLIARGEI